MNQPRCSDGSLLAGEQLAGTAPTSSAWVALEQSGPWGARAFTASHLDPSLGRALEDTAARHDVRPALVRRPGPHADDRGPAGADRSVLVAFTHPAASWLLEGRIGDPAELLALDWSALQCGEQETVRRSLPALVPSTRPHLLVCTNARRDVCCAVKGRPVALGAAALRPEQVWEVTHTSGHRFAPTAVLLPAGTLHGRLDVALAGALLQAAERGETVLDGARGRSTWPGPAQVAELAVRETHSVLGLDVLTVTRHQQEGPSSWVSELVHDDGRSWRVTTHSRPSDVRRTESCGKDLAAMAYHTTQVTAVRRG